MIHTCAVYLLCVFLEYRSWNQNCKNGCAAIAPRFFTKIVSVAPLRMCIIYLATRAAPLSQGQFLLASLIILVPIACEHLFVSDQASGGSDLSDPNPSEGSDLSDPRQPVEAVPHTDQTNSLAGQRVDTDSDSSDHRQPVPGSGSPIRGLPTNLKKRSLKIEAAPRTGQAHSLAGQRVDTHVGLDGGVDVSARDGRKTPAVDHLFENLGLHGSDRTPVLIVQVFLVCYKNMRYRSGDKIEELSAYTDWKTIYNSYQEHPRDKIAFFVFTDDERIMEHCKNERNDAIRSIQSPTFANYTKNLDLIATEAGVYSLVTHFGMHAHGGNLGGILFKNPDDGHTPAITYRNSLERANNYFLSNRKDRGFQNVLFWTMVFDMCFAKNQTQFPVNYNLRKYELNGIANVSINKIHTQDCPGIYNPEQVVVICLSSSNAVNLSRELKKVAAPGRPTEFYSPFTDLVYKKGQQVGSTNQTTPIKLCASLNTECPDPIPLIIPFVHLMNHSLSMRCGGVKCENTPYARKRNYGPKGYSTGVLYWSTNVEDRTNPGDGDGDSTEKEFRAFIERKCRELTHER
jgi:hypothetical protein